MHGIIQARGEIIEGFQVNITNDVHTIFLEVRLYYAVK